MQSVVLFN